MKLPGDNHQGDHNQTQAAAAPLKPPAAARPAFLLHLLPSPPPTKAVKTKDSPLPRLNRCASFCLSWLAAAAQRKHAGAGQRATVQHLRNTFLFVCNLESLLLESSSSSCTRYTEEKSVSNTSFSVPLSLLLQRQALVCARPGTQSHLLCATTSRPGKAVRPTAKHNTTQTVWAIPWRLSDSDYSVVVPRISCQNPNHFCCFLLVSSLATFWRLYYYSISGHFLTPPKKIAFVSSILPGGF